MAIAFSHFDKRGYRTLGAREGYGAWAPTYEATVLDLMDIRLFERLTRVDWGAASNVTDLACGTGRIGVWLRSKGVGRLTGVDFTREMLELAVAKGAYDELRTADVAATGLAAGAYDLVVQSLADEHFATLEPFYAEAARLTAPGGRLALAGYHPHFAMQGMPTHFNSASGEPLAVETHVHLLSDQVAAGLGAGLQLIEMVEGLVDEDWIAAKPKWAALRRHPVSFAMVWARPG